MAFRKKQDRRLIKSKTINIDGINFKSRLEAFMYGLLKQNDINFEYEGESFELSPSFVFNNDYFARLSSGKGDFINRGHKNIHNMSYKPDFVIKQKTYYAIIETKGLPTEPFNMRMKLFKRLVEDRNIQCDIFVPQTQSECVKTMEIILNKINKNGI
jgi:hypothetical protein